MAPKQALPSVGGGVALRSNLPGVTGFSDPVAALTAFCVDNPALEQLEAILGEFNLFEAAGLRREEVRHSRFLSFLLNPRGAHGLGPLFVTRFLQAAVHGRAPEEVGVTALDLELMNLGDLTVECERERIDILMLSEANRFAVVVENKVGAGEHSNQLPRYLKAVGAMRPGWRVLPILLSPEGIEPSDERYFPVSYETVAAILGTILDTRRTTLGPDVALVLAHYERLLQRHVVTDPKLKELLLQIVAKHRPALELLIEHMGDPKTRVWGITDLMMEEFGFVKLSGNSGGKWLPQPWLDWVPQDEATGLHLLSFWVNAWTKRPKLILELQPGDVALREKVFAAVKRHGAPFTAKGDQVAGKWGRMLSYELAATLAPEGNDEVWESGIEDKLRLFGTTVLPRIEPVLQRAVEASA